MRFFRLPTLDTYTFFFPPRPTSFSLRHVKRRAPLELCSSFTPLDILLRPFIFIFLRSFAADFYPFCLFLHPWPCVLAWDRIFELPFFFYCIPRHAGVLYVLGTVGSIELHVVCMLYMIPFCFCRFSRVYEVHRIYLISIYRYGQYELTIRLLELLFLLFFQTRFSLVCAFFMVRLGLRDDFLCYSKIRVSPSKNVLIFFVLTVFIGSTFEKRPPFFSLFI